MPITSLYSAHYTTTITTMALPLPPPGTALSSETIRKYSMLRPQYEWRAPVFRMRTPGGTTVAICHALDVVPDAMTRADEAADFDEATAINPYPIVVPVPDTPDRERELRIRRRLAARRARPWPVAAGLLDTPPAWPCTRPDPPT